MIAVGWSRARLDTWFVQVTRVATVDDGLGLDNDEQGGPIYLCRGLRQPWPELWPRLRRYG